MDNQQAVAFFQSLLGKQLRITTTDTRMFIGEMKCTDKVRLRTIHTSGSFHCHSSDFLRNET